ncbi:hypothetical protein [Rodentibacter trehalosifermentans]|uniref:hypothetical protein n=1 Tax=Rodentibacter trehalosifermentans TaxID=1908263 RepID=UPI0009879EF7|nr:hypothetical protein [Rodentibacter trehalosifermentans]OOF48630.1 hypothetical protein BKK53_09500 [Rodentibacter trehalosifermentans]
MTINQFAQGNVQNMVAGDQHNHYHTDPIVEKRIKAERQQMRTTLLQYRNGKFPEFHNLLCDYARVNFGDSRFTELTDEQLTKLYQYHQNIILIADRLAKIKPKEKAGFKSDLINKIKQCFTKEPK